ncbi:DUF2851 family protein [uncultured Bacteroides sp.]|uniref:DUF2851 family protein n=1 Tax=uncultured Bacteroides sp. TaxID=162156 RepID=UPI0026074559|nr:DUF2851 family protein [uncultured Bacteroides sp.]
MEQLLHYVWKHKLFTLKPLHTIDDQPLEIIDPGLPNRNAGPDFFNAKIKIGGVLWVGNIEIHLQASDWFRHGHDKDKAYDSVILHVASEVDALPVRSNGEPIPQMELHFPPYLQKNYDELLHTDHYPACYQLIPKLPKILLHSWLSALQVERFESKDKQIKKRLNDSNGDWEQAFFVTLARNFGFGVNSDTFELWAKHIPLSAVNKHRDNLFQVEAIFFGQAGLLEELPLDAYTEKLMKEYAYLSHKFGLHPQDECRWRFLRLRPSNFPHIRIAQLACLYHRSQGLLSRLMEKETLKEVREELKGGTSGYWLTHFRFGELSPECTKSLSNPSIDLIIINTIVPFLYAYGKHKLSEALCNRAEKFLEELKPENNHIVRMWKECGLEATHAGDSQALIQLKKSYCDTKKCLFCRIGYEYFKKKE